MAYIKYKELTRYFNFNKKVPLEEIPDYVFQYIEEKENILLAYKVRRDIVAFTNKKIIIFDIRGLMTDNRKIHILPYKGISSSAIEFQYSKISLYLVMDSGYQLRINFVSLSAENKKELRQTYTELVSNSINKG